MAVRYQPAGGWLSVAGLSQALGAVVLGATLGMTGGPLGAGVGLLAIPVWLFGGIPLTVGVVHLGLLVVFPETVPLAPLLGVELALAFAILGRLETSGAPRPSVVGFLLAGLGLAWVTLAGLWYGDAVWVAAVLIAGLTGIGVYGIHRYDVAWREMEGYA